MFLPVQFTPVNSSQALLPGETEECPGRFYNKKSVCRLCGGMILGTQVDKCFTGKCCVCGQLYIKVYREDNKWLRLLLQLFSYCNTPDIKFWSPSWVSELPLPVIEAIHGSFMFCRDIKPFLDRLSYLSMCGHCFKISSEKRKSFKRGPCWIAVLESAPGRLAGLRIFSERSASNIWFDARRSWREWSLFNDKNRPFAGHFLKLAPEMTRILDSWDELADNCMDDLLGERQDHAVFINQVK